MSAVALSDDDWVGLFVVPPGPSVPDDAQPTLFPDAPLSPSALVPRLAGRRANVESRPQARL